MNKMLLILLVLMLLMLLKNKGGYGAAGAAGAAGYSQPSYYQPSYSQPSYSQPSSKKKSCPSGQYKTPGNQTCRTCPPCKCDSPSAWPLSGCNIKCGAKCPGQGCCKETAGAMLGRGVQGAKQAKDAGIFDTIASLF